VKFIKTVCLNDEHNQPINILHNDEGFWWEWTLITGEIYGPYEVEADAYLAANDFANDGAAS
jgi:hypothetical protein